MPARLNTAATLVATNTVPIGANSRGGTMSRSGRLAGFVICATLITFATAAKFPAPDDACSVLTKEDAAAALGEAAGGPKATGPMTDGTGATVSGCEYTGSGIHRLQLNVTRLAASSVPMFKQLCAKSRTDGLAGMGDVACWYKDKHEELHVIKGTAFISIALRRSGDPTEPIKALMKKALAKLK
jgi:hypothetical protein